MTMTHTLKQLAIEKRRITLAARKLTQDEAKMLLSKPWYVRRFWLKDHDLQAYPSVFMDLFARRLGEVAGKSK